MAKRRRPKKKNFSFNLSDFDFKLYLLIIASAIFGSVLVASSIVAVPIFALILGLSGVAIGILYVLISNDYKKVKKRAV